MLPEARPLEPADLGDVSAEEVRQAPARAVRELASDGMVPSTFTSDERTQRRLRRAAQLSLEQHNHERTLRSRLSQSLNGLFVPSLFS